ncbi:hypothetical protein [Demequina maris]|uniref:hypothetical protein n=1 Tax=Demequina maris TaxID=1638982 RepID=UPI000784E8CB|nr:hypothetical protein [Demequina maris]
MTIDDLRTRIAGAIDAEERRFNGEHRGQETAVYERAIGPRRTARRAMQAAGALAVTVVAVVGVHALVLERSDSGPAAPPVTPSADASVAVPDVSGVVFNPGIGPVHLSELGDGSLASSPACAELDAYSRLEGREDLGGTSAQPGAFVSNPGGGSNAFATRTFGSREGAAEFLDELGAAAASCAREVAAAGVEVEVTDLGISGVAGSGLRIRVTPEAEDTWQSRVHVLGTRAASVVIVDPWGVDASGAIFQAWFTAGVG